MSLKCGHCKKKFSGTRFLTQHTKSKVCYKVHKCEKCCKTFSSASNLRSHLKRKNPCVPSEIPVIDLNDEENKCKYCGKCYVSPYNLKRHIGSCPMKDNQGAVMQLLLEKMERLEAQNQQLMANQQVQQITNINNTTNVQQNLYLNVTICSFGNEDLSRLDPAEVMKLIKNNTKDFMPKMIEHVHANPNMPDFHNVFYDPELQKAMVFAQTEDNKLTWQIREIEDVSTDLTSKIKEHIDPIKGPYFNMAGKNRDADTSNSILDIIHKDWTGEEVLDQTKVSLSKVPKNNGFKELVNATK